MADRDGDASQPGPSRSESVLLSHHCHPDNITTPQGYKQQGHYKSGFTPTRFGQFSDWCLTSQELFQNPAKSMRNKKKGLFLSVLNLYSHKCKTSIVLKRKFLKEPFRSRNIAKTWSPQLFMINWINILASIEYYSHLLLKLVIRDLT